VEVCEMIYVNDIATLLARIFEANPKRGGRDMDL
jgi:hypothetical protein